MNNIPILKDKYIKYLGHLLKQYNIPYNDDFDNWADGQMDRDESITFVLKKHSQELVTMESTLKRLIKRVDTLQTAMMQEGLFRKEEESGQNKGDK